MQRTTLFLIVISAAIAAQAQDVPHRKSGLWEIKRSPTDAHPLQMCVEEKNDNALRFLAEGKHKESCKVEKKDRASLTVSLQTSVMDFPAMRTARASARSRVPPHSGHVA